MTRYDEDAWWRLGQAVHTARMMRTELRDTKAWSEAVHVSTRTLLGLERGKSVGHETITAIEQTLGWPPDFAFKVLADREASTVPPPPVTPQADPLTGT